MTTQNAAARHPAGRHPAAGQTSISRQGANDHDRPADCHRLGDFASGTLGLNVYSFAGRAGQTLFASADMGQGSGALAWLTGDFSVQGSTQIAQPWENLS
jgi:hypothetical protein